MNFAETLDQVAKNGHLAERGWLDKDLLEAYSNNFASNLLQRVQKILESPSTTLKNKEMKVVSLQLATLVPESQAQNLECLCSSRRTFLTKGLWRLLVPLGAHRFQIESLREKTVANLRNQKEPSAEEKNILSELYFLLSLGSREIWELFQHPIEPSNQSQIKKCLTSLKKMMGNEVEMEEEDKKLKKKAYSNNLEIRRVLQAISTLIVEEDLGRKVRKMLQAPKNKKWFGTRLNRLMVNDQWTPAEMKVFADYLEHSWTMKEIEGVKMGKAKGTLKQIHTNIVRALEGDASGGSQCVADQTETKREEKGPLKGSVEEIVEISADSLGSSSKRYSLFECLLQESSHDLY